MKSLNNIKESVRYFINNNRQVGNTTIAIESALKHNAYLIVADNLQKQKIKKDYPNLHIYTLGEIAFGKTLGSNKMLPIIFDPHAVFLLCSSENSEEIDLNQVNKFDETFTFSDTEKSMLKNQVNIKLSDEQLNSVKELNNTLFEGEATLPTVIRLLIKKGLKYFQSINM